MVDLELHIAGSTQADPIFSVQKDHNNETWIYSSARGSEHLIARFYSDDAKFQEPNARATVIKHFLSRDSSLSGLT